MILFDSVSIDIVKCQFLDTDFPINTDFTAFRLWFYAAYPKFWLLLKKKIKVCEKLVSFFLSCESLIFRVLISYAKFKLETQYYSFVNFPTCTVHNKLSIQSINKDRFVEISQMLHGIRNQFQIASIIIANTSS